MKRIVFAFVAAVATTSIPSLSQGEWHSSTKVIDKHEGGKHVTGKLTTETNYATNVQIETTYEKGVRPEDPTEWFSRHIVIYLDINKEFATLYENRKMGWGEDSYLRGDHTHSDILYWHDEIGHTHRIKCAKIDYADGHHIDDRTVSTFNAIPQYQISGTRIVRHIGGADAGTTYSQYDPAKKSWGPSGAFEDGSGCDDPKMPFLFLKEKPM
jgi:hypothetical protein